MPPITSIQQIDLSPLPGKTYTNFTREWREEFIYFLMVDRFHDSTPRQPLLTPGRSPGIPTPDNFYGGTIKGIQNHLDYIAGLGCTAIWLSPVFGNNAGAYHGYNINRESTQLLPRATIRFRRLARSGSPLPNRTPR